jgi:hypothetical protein
MSDEIGAEEITARTYQTARVQRAGVLITLIAVVGAVAIVDIVAEMVVTLAKLKSEGY